jgi:hypothetical protein
MYFDVSRGNLNGIFTYLYNTNPGEMSNIVSVSGTNVQTVGNYDPQASVTPDSLES